MPLLRRCVINGSVVCNNVYMKEKCNIKDSQIGVSYNVPEKSALPPSLVLRSSFILCSFVDLVSFIAAPSFAGAYCFIAAGDTPHS